MTATIPLGEALQTLDDTLADVRLPAQTVPTRDAIGRTLAKDHVSRLDLPPFNKSAMDGYAILAGDERDEYELLETTAAGRTPQATLEPGTTVAVMTGAPVPDGAGKVVMIEHTERDDDRIRVLRHSSKGNICIKGEDVTEGDTIAKAGTALTPWDVANLISCGVTEVEVVQRPKMAVINTGNELVDSPDLIEPGKIMNANGPLLAALASVSGIDVVSEQSVSDDRQDITDAIEAGLRNADIVVLSGGVSVGEFDFVIQALGDAGLTVHFSRVAVKPGKPMTFASGDGKAAFGLPGNPVSVCLTFHLHVLRAARLISGARPDLRHLSLPLADQFTRRKTGRREYCPARLSDRTHVEPIEYHGSAHLMALSQADGFFTVPRGVDSIPAGGNVEFLPLLMRLP